MILLLKLHCCYFFLLLWSVCVAHDNITTNTSGSTVLTYVATALCHGCIVEKSHISPNDVLKTCQSSVLCWELLVQFAQHSHNLGNVVKAAAASHTYQKNDWINFITYGTVDCHTRLKVLMRRSEIFLFELRGRFVLSRSDRWITSLADNIEIQVKSWPWPSLTGVRNVIWWIERKIHVFCGNWCFKSFIFFICKIFYSPAHPADVFCVISLLLMLP